MVRNGQSDARLHEGDAVEVPWGVDTVRGRVLEVYGPATRRNALVEVDLGAEFDTRVGREVERHPTISLPVDAVRRLTPVKEQA